MKRLMIVALTVAIAPLAVAQTLYKHVGKDGRTVYSDQPPVGVDAKTVNIPKSVSDAPAKSYVAQDKENEKKRKDAAEKAAKNPKEDPEKKARDAEQRCAQAKSAYQTYADGGRIYKNNDKGERTFLSDSEIDSERARSRREMDEACQGR
jgi:hypothetical protein